MNAAGRGARTPRPEALALVPGARNVLAIEPLTGGSVNDLWRVDTHLGSFVLRQDGADWRRPGVNREREWQAHSLAAAAGLAPRLVGRSTGGEVLISEFIAGRVWDAADFARPRQLERLCERLERVHRLSLPDLPLWQFDPCALARDYAARADRASAAPEAIAALLADTERGWEQWQQHAQPPVLTHGDPLAGNVIDDGQLWLIDWEFTQRADPVWDVAGLAAWQDFPAEQLRALAVAAGAAPKLLVQRLEAALALQRALGGLWYLARGEVAPALVTGAGSGQTSRP